MGGGGFEFLKLELLELVIPKSDYTLTFISTIWAIWKPYLKQTQIKPLFLALKGQLTPQNESFLRQITSNGKVKNPYFRAERASVFLNFPLENLTYIALTATILHFYHGLRKIRQLCHNVKNTNSVRLQAFVLALGSIYWIFKRN